MHMFDLLSKYVNHVFASVLRICCDINIQEWGGGDAPFHTHIKWNPVLHVLFRQRNMVC